jgi:hypothetical protein
LPFVRLKKRAEWQPAAEWYQSLLYWAEFQSGGKLVSRPDARLKNDYSISTHRQSARRARQNQKYCPRLSSRRHSGRAENATEFSLRLLSSADSFTASNACRLRFRQPASLR